MAQNVIAHDYLELEPVVDRVKLDGDEYNTGNRRQNKESAAAGASLEVFKSLESLPSDCQEAITESIHDNLMSGALLGYPVVNTRVRILDGRWSNIRSRNPLIWKQCTT